ncbi:MAG: protein kinase domain-containing protein [Kofleriaceae bacterium]
MSAAETIKPGDRIGRFVVVRHLGAGGMGTVFEARDPELSRAVAIKLVIDRDADPIRLLREAQALARISHPNVVAIYELDSHIDDVFVAMELIDGVTIDRYILDNKCGWREVIALYMQAGRGICAVHEQGLVHRDIKPSNLLVDRDGRVRVGDFGLARRDDGEGSVPSGEVERRTPVSSAADTVEGPTATSLDSQPDSRPGVARAERGALDAQITAHGAVVGTPRYMAPEQHAGGKVTRAADQYAFAVALWEAVYGKLPDDHREAPARAGVPAWVERVLARALAPVPSARWPTMAQFLDELERAPRRRRRIAIGAGGGVVVAVATAAVFGLGLFDAAKVDCERAADPITAAWTADTRARITSAFGDLGTAWAPTVTPVIDGLDRWGERAKEVRIESCRATHVRGSQTAVLLDKRTACLDGQQAVFDALVAVLVKADRLVAERSLVAVERLPGPETCTAARLIDATVVRAGPIDAAIAEATVAVELQRPDAGTLTERLVDTTKASPPALRGRAHLLRARVLTAKDPKAARAELDAALADAASSRDSGLEADVMITTLLIAADSESADRIDALLPAARAAVTRAGDPRPLAHSLSLAEVGVHVRLGRAEQAKEACTRVTNLADAANANFAAADCGCKNALLLRDPEEVTACAGAVEIARKVLGPGHPRTADLTHNWITALVRRRKLPKAETESRANIALWTSLYGRDSRHVVSGLQLLSVVQDRADQIAESRATLEEALAISDRINGTDSPMRVGLLLELADRALQQKDRAAIEYAETGLAASERLLGAEHRDLAAVLIVHARALALDPTLIQRARESWGRALAVAEKRAGPKSIMFGTTLESYAYFLVGQEELLESLEPAQRSVEVFDAAGDSYIAGKNEILVAEIYMELKRMSEARAWLTKARTRFLARSDEKSKGKLVEIDALLAKAK